MIEFDGYKNLKVIEGIHLPITYRVDESFCL